jgi:hypothetical protein
MHLASNEIHVYQETARRACVVIPAWSSDASIGVCSFIQSCGLTPSTVTEAQTQKEFNESTQITVLHVLIGLYVCLARAKQRFVYSACTASRRPGAACTLSNTVIVENGPDTEPAFCRA